MAPARKDVLDRFWSKVDRTDGCWNWTASKQKGYGQFVVERGDHRRAHRMSYEWLVGPIPDGLVLDHLCRNRACVNPAHLEAVTHQINILRGTSPNAVVAKTNLCLRGHDLTVHGHLRHRSNGRSYRLCLPCAAIREHARKASS